MDRFEVEIIVPFIQVKKDFGRHPFIDKVFVGSNRPGLKKRGVPLRVITAFQRFRHGL